jgi:hypothetical protein
MGARCDEKANVKMTKGHRHVACFIGVLYLFVTNFELYGHISFCPRYRLKPPEEYGRTLRDKTILISHTVAIKGIGRPGLGRRCTT